MRRDVRVTVTRRGASALVRLSMLLTLWLFSWAGSGFAQTLPNARQVQGADLPGADHPRATIDLDVRQVMGHFMRLGLDDRSDQILDWGMYAAATGPTVTDEAARQALHDAPPLRDSRFEELANYQYGPGRSLVLGGGRVLLFYHYFDRTPRATVARLVDHVRMEQGQLPERFEVYRCRLDLPTSRVKLERVDDIPRDEMFSAAYGYHERVVASANELGAFIAEVDSLTHVELDAEQHLHLGGRRFEEARTLGVTLDDIAVLYQSQHEILGTAGIREAVRLHEQLVDIARTSEYAWTWARGAEFDLLVARIETILAHRPVQARVHLWHTDRVAAANSIYRRLRPLLPRAMQAVEQPGFSLDPTYDKRRLLADLTLLTRDPDRLVREARLEAATTVDARVRGGDLRTRRAHEIREGVPNGVFAAVPALVGTWSNAINSARRDIERADDAVTSVRLAQLRGQLVRSNTMGGALVGQVFDYVESRSRMSCARYDGGIGGTQVAMTLFYTDRLAKLWALFNYEDSAPIDAVPGFPLSERVLAAFTITAQEPDDTRLWFGPREDRQSVINGGLGLRFAPIAIRLFAKGSSSEVGLREEGTPSEATRRLLTWWDKHFQALADHEQQYYRQNEIIKWSVATAWLAQHGLLHDLRQLRPDRGQRFDRWLATNADSLRYGRGFPTLPPSRWVRQTECLPALTSRDVHTSRGEMALAGGVSAGGAPTLTNLRPAAVSLPSSMRRGGLQALPTTPNGPQGYTVASRGVTSIREGAYRVSLRLDSAERAAAATRNGRPSSLNVEVRNTTSELRATLRPDIEGSTPTDLAFRRAESGEITVVRRSAARAGQSPDVDRLTALAEQGASTEEPLRALRAARAAGTLSPENGQAVVTSLEERGFSSTAEAARVQLGMTDIAVPTRLGEFHEAMLGGIPRLVRDLPNAPLTQVSPEQILTAHRAARNGGRVHIFADEGATAICDLAAHPFRSLADYQRAGVTVERVTLEGGTAHPDVLRVGGRDYYRAFSSDMVEDAAADAPAEVYVVRLGSATLGKRKPN